jgi:hypothetical protein
MYRLTLVSTFSCLNTINRRQEFIQRRLRAFKNSVISSFYIPFPNREVSTFSTSFFLYPLKLYLKVREIRRES